MKILMDPTRTLGSGLLARWKMCGVYFAKTICLAVSVCTLMPGMAKADLIAQSGYFTDTNTELDWLNNIPLAGQSYNSVLAGAGGYTTSGWRFATASDLETLVNGYVGVGSLSPGGPAATYHNSDPNAQTPAMELINLLGLDIAFGNPPNSQALVQVQATSTIGIATQGWYDDGTGGSMVGVFDFSAYFLPDSQPDYLVTTQIIPDFEPANDFHGLNVSAFLVRDNVTSVPEPSGLSLLLPALGLLGLMIWLNRTRPFQRDLK